MLGMCMFCAAQTAVEQPKAASNRKETPRSAQVREARQAKVRVLPVSGDPNAAVPLPANYTPHPPKLRPAATANQQNGTMQVQQTK